MKIIMIIIINQTPSSCNRRVRLTSRVHRQSLLDSSTFIRINQVLVTSRIKVSSDTRTCRTSIGLRSTGSHRRWATVGLDSALKPETRTSVHRLVPTLMSTRSTVMQLLEAPDGKREGNRLSLPLTTHLPITITTQDKCLCVAQPVLPLSM